MHCHLWFITETMWSVIHYIFALLKQNAFIYDCCRLLWDCNCCLWCFIPFKHLLLFFSVVRNMPVWEWLAGIFMCYKRRRSSWPGVHCHFHVWQESGWLLLSHCLWHRVRQHWLTYLPLHSGQWNLECTELISVFHLYFEILLVWLLGALVLSSAMCFNCWW